MKKELKNRIVYRHRNPITNEVFYVGSGIENRGFETWSSRHGEKWNSICSEYGKPIVEILARDLTKGLAP